MDSSPKCFIWLTELSSRVPHGFHEHEMRAYFSQFGTITRLRLSRNKHTGKSKHYAFLEFQDPYVARIAAATMDKYLLCGHILQCRLVPPAQVHPELWRGANRRYKVMPRNKMEGRKLNTARGREVWRERLNKERRRRREKGERLKALGFDYDFEPPRLMDVDSVEVRRITGGKEETKAIEEKGALEREDNDVAPEARPQESETIARVAVDVA